MECALGIERGVKTYKMAARGEGGRPVATGWSVEMAMKVLLAADRQRS